MSEIIDLSTEGTKESTGIDTSEKKNRRKRTKSIIDTELTAPKTTEKTDTETLIIKTGDAVEIRLALLYRSSAAPDHFTGIKGNFYIWNDEVVNGRVRLTDSPSGVGNVGRIVGWVNITDI